MSEAVDAVVIGSGPNGLCAAIRLARAGRSVRVYETRDTVGGGARTSALTLEGFHHDVCSAIHPMAIGSPFLRTLPLEAHGLRWVHPDAPLAHPFDDGPAVLMERSVAATAEALGRDGRGYRWLMDPMVRRWEALFADGMAPLGLPRSPLLLARFGARAMWPATWLAKALFREPRARALLAGLAAHAILPLEKPFSSAIGLMLGVAGHAVGWPMPRGGAQALSDALASLLRSLGGEIVTGHRVERLDALPTRGPVLFDTAPRAMLAIAGDALPDGYARRVRRFRHGPGVFKVDWALAEPIPWRDPQVARAGTVHLGGTLDELAVGEREAWRGEHVERPFVLLAQQSLFDDTRAPAGRHTGWAYCHVPNGSTLDRAAVIEAQVERYAPGFRDCVLARAATNTEGFEAYNANYIGGDVNGGAPDITQLFTRPVARRVPYSTPNPRLFLCSASTPPGGGVHGMCGFFAAEAALRRWP
ncbi:MAG: NAD(P)/FAD-dependent oxidoreductase [Alphaproteobacteria bacterium]|nr:NAD(P)/FAD-dependent oxidoreductase [Alphaproteobacteria bacterium]